MAIHTKSVFLSVWLFFQGSIYLTVSGQNQIVLINYATTIEVSKNELKRTADLTYQIENKRSAWISEFEIPFQNEKGFKLIAADILDTKGNVLRSLKKKDILTLNDQSRETFYQDKFIKQFSLSWHDYPYRVRVSYESKASDFIWVSYWTPYTYSRIPVLQASLEVILPHEYPVSISYPPGAHYDSVRTDDGIKLTWKYSKLPFIKAETYSPSIDDLIPWIKIVPHNFKFGTKGDLTTWQTYGNWQYSINKELLGLTLQEKFRINQLIEGISSKREIAKVLYYYLQDNTRYINVSIDEGGLIPYPASYVCMNKYGDCKALTIYMMALLKYAGIDSYYVDVHAGEIAKKIDSNLPSQQFNHVILAVPIDGDTLWLENTSKVLPFNYLGSFTQDRPALWISEKESHLVDLPASRKSTKTYKSKVVYNQDGKGEIETIIGFEGDAFADLKYIAKSFSIRDQQQFIQENYAPENSINLEYSFIEGDRDLPFIELALKAELLKSYRRLANNLVLYPPPVDIAKFELPEKRKHEVVIPVPIEHNDTIDYHLDFIKDGFELEERLIARESTYGSYQVEVVKRPDGFTLIRQLKLYKQNVPIELYPEFFQFVTQLKKTFSKSIILSLSE